MSAPIIPDAVWAQGDQRIRVLDCLRDGSIRIERIAGAPDHALRRPFVTSEGALRAAFEPTDEWCFS